MTQITKSQSGGNQLKQTNLSVDPGNDGNLDLATAQSEKEGTNVFVTYVGTSEYDPNAYLVNVNTASDNITKQSVYSGTGPEDLPSDVFVAATDKLLQVGFVIKETVFAEQCSEGANECTEAKGVSENNVTCPTPTQTTNPESTSGLNDTPNEAGTPELTPTRYSNFNPVSNSCPISISSCSQCRSGSKCNWRK